MIVGLPLGAPSSTQAAWSWLCNTSTSTVSADDWFTGFIWLQSEITLKERGAMLGIREVEPGIIATLLCFAFKWKEHGGVWVAIDCNFIQNNTAVSHTHLLLNV